MALTTCSSCGKPMSDTLDICPHCGATFLKPQEPITENSNFADKGHLKDEFYKKTQDNSVETREAFSRTVDYQFSTKGNNNIKSINYFGRGEDSVVSLFKKVGLFIVILGVVLTIIYSTVSGVNGGFYSFFSSFCSHMINFIVSGFTIWGIGEIINILKKNK